MVPHSGIAVLAIQISHLEAQRGCNNTVKMRITAPHVPTSSGSVGKESTCNAGDLLQAGDTSLIPVWVRKTPWRRKWQPTPVLLPGRFQGPEETGLRTEPPRPPYPPYCKSDQPTMPFLPKHSASQLLIGKTGVTILAQGKLQHH